MNKTINSPYPDIKYIDTHFYIVFEESYEYLEISERERSEQKTWVEGLAESQKKIIELVKINPKISKSQKKKCQTGLVSIRHQLIKTLKN